MDYIVLDLEWNQAGRIEDSNGRIPFEIVEIGAVKLNAEMEVVDTFHEMIKPQIYRKMHGVTERLIHIHMRELEDCRHFPEVLRDFLAWCGPDCRFATWGTQDLTELQRNMRFFGLGALSAGPFPFLDVQKLFGLTFQNGDKTQRSLSFAVQFLGLSREGDFHRALSDALYTADVLIRIGGCAGGGVGGADTRNMLERVSYDTFTLPADRSREIHVVPGDYAKYISRAFPTREGLLTDPEVTSTRCYLCGKCLRQKVRWFTANGKHYYSVSQCGEHGLMKGKLRVRRNDEGLFYAVKTFRFIGQEEMESLLAKKESPEQELAFQIKKGFLERHR